MNQLENINAKLQELNVELTSYASSLEFEKVCEFNIENCATTIPWNDLVFSGIYFIEIKSDPNFQNFQNWVNHFTDEWQHDDYKIHFVSNLRKIRVNKHINKALEEWIPMYIGKSRQVGGRIHQHIYKELGKPTFALKLNARKNMRNKTFRLSTIKVSAHNYDWVMPVFEKTLRNKINPIIGRQ